jgi:hypothetical protein
MQERLDRLVMWAGRMSVWAVAGLAMLASLAAGGAAAAIGGMIPALKVSSYLVTTFLLSPLIEEAGRWLVARGASRCGQNQRMIATVLTYTIALWGLATLLFALRLVLSHSAPAILLQVLMQGRAKNLVVEGCMAALAAFLVVRSERPVGLRELWLPAALTIVHGLVLAVF